MPLIRVNHFGPRGGGRKTLKVKKKAAARQEWDVSLRTVSKVFWGVDAMTVGVLERSCSRLRWVSRRVFDLGGKSRIFAPP